MPVIEVIYFIKENKNKKRVQNNNNKKNIFHLEIKKDKKKK